MFIEDVFETSVTNNNNLSIQLYFEVNKMIWGIQAGNTFVFFKIDNRCFPVGMVFIEKIISHQ